MAENPSPKIPSQHKALALIEKGRAEAREKTLPPVSDDGIVVKIKAVALNPTDWKHVDSGLLKPNSSIGCDFAGDVVYIGKNAKTTHFKAGDSVAGFVRGGYVEPANGAFQEYVSTLPQLVWKMHSGITYEEAAPMGGIALSTAVQALFYRLNLPKPWEPAAEPIPIVIWSGATGVGMYAIRLAKLAGLRVATVASEKNHALVKKLGADVVFDYRDPEAPSRIKAWGDNKIQHALDTISEGGSTDKTVACLGDQGGKVVTLLPVKKTADDKDWPSNIIVTDVLIYSVLKPKNKQDFEDISEWYSKLSTDPKLIPGLKIVPLKIWEKDGIESIPSALDFLRAGKNSGEKVVVKL